MEKFINEKPQNIQIIVIKLKGARFWWFDLSEIWALIFSKYKFQSCNEFISQ